MFIPTSERSYLRELARRRMEIAHLPVMAERARLWTAHNELRSPRPMIVVEMGTFRGDVLPPLRCTTELGREIEQNLLEPIISHEIIDDDKVVPTFYAVPWHIHLREFDLDFNRTHAADAEGRMLGFEMAHPITDLERDLPRLKHSLFSVDRDATATHRAAVEEVLGDLMPVEVENRSLLWYAMPTLKVINLMGMEAMMIALIEQPDAMRALLDFVSEDILLFLRWQEREGLLTLNNGNHYAGSGSYGFTTELPRSRDGVVRLNDLWLNMNSQETVVLSPAMFADMVLPAYVRIADVAGWVYYGCCEPVHDLWDRGLKDLPNLRKVSVSPWCDEERMGAALRGGRVIYSRKPEPHFLGVDAAFDSEGFKAHIEKTLRAAQGCTLEIIYRDVYTLCGDLPRAGRTVQIIREAIDRLWYPVHD